MVNYVCGICDSSTSVKRNVRLGCKEENWAAIRHGMRDIGRHGSTETWICLGCRAFVKMRLRRSQSLDLQSRVEKVANKRRFSNPDVQQPPDVDMDQSVNVDSDTSLFSGSHSMVHLQ